jgi:hypothetical protein
MLVLLWSRARNDCARLMTARLGSRERFLTISRQILPQIGWP